jgi:predicted molibdopterin-dependent oxidoreductase YjgC
MQLTIDDRTVELAEGESVLDGVNRLGVPLPQLCKDPDRPALGACRTCLVHVDGMRGVPAACHLPARDGMVVSTQHPEAVRVRTTVLDLTRSMLTAGGARDGLGQVGAATARHGVHEPAWPPLHRFAVDDTKSFFVLDRDACILCGRCTVACDDVQQIGAIALLGRGHATKVGVFGDGEMASSTCTSCGQCVATCPTGALRPKEAPARIVRSVETTCPYCGVGCGIEARVTDAGRLAVLADDVPANRSSRGMLCVKGRFGTGFVHARDRITAPMVKRDGRWVPVGWDEALAVAAEGLARHRGRFGALASAKATNEDGYLVQKLCRVVMGTNNVDHCTRLCHSPSVEAMLASMGSGATSNSYQDYEEAGCIMVVGADASANHPVIAVRFRRAVSRGARLVVVNPKRVELCDQADLWIQQRPGTDVALFNAMARVIIDEGLADEAFVRARTEGFHAWRGSLERYTLEYAERVTGVPAVDIAQAARWYAKPPTPDRGGLRPPQDSPGGSCLVWGMGVTQHVNGIHNAHALLNLSLVAGQMGRPGTGISPLRGQNNVQGCGDAGCIPTNLPGYQLYAPETLARFEAAWGVRPPGRTGRVVTEMVEGCLSGDTHAMYVVGENPLLSEPDLHHAEKAFGQLDFLVGERGHVHQLRAARAARPRRAAAARRGAAGLVDHRRVGQAGGAPSGARGRAPVRLRGSRRDLRRDGATDAVPGRAVARAPGPRGRPAVAVPHARAPGHALPLRRVLPPRARPLHSGAPDRGGGRATRPRLPVRAQHRAVALPLARRHPHPARAGPAGAGAAPGDRDSSQRRPTARRGHRLAAARRFPTRRADRLRPGDRGRAHRRDLHSVRQAIRLGRQLPDERGRRSRLEDPRVQGLRRPARTPALRRRCTPSPARTRCER